MKIRISRSALGLLAVGGLAYAAGYFHVLPVGEPGAWAQAGKEQPKQLEPNPQMQAYIEAGTPGANHRYLDALVGEWTGEFKMSWGPDQPAEVSQGTVTREWMLGGRYLKESVEATSPMGTFNGYGIMGYNNIDGQYEFAWVDSMSTAIWCETGTYNPQTKILTTRGSHRDPVTGHIVYGWGRIDMSNADRHTFVGYSTAPDGKEYKSMEGALARKHKP